MNVPSFYQADMFRALIATGEANVRAVFVNTIPPDRQQLGWQDDLAGYDCEFLSRDHPITDAIMKVRAYRDSIHIVGGWAGRVITTILLALMVHRARFYVYSEAPDPRDHIGPVKAFVLQLLGRSILRRAQGILAISHLAINHFRSYGIHESHIHPFGYFRAQPPQRPKHTSRRKNITFIYVGQLIHRKGIDILFEATRPLFNKHRSLVLRLVGTGDMEPVLRDWVRRNNLTDRIVFEGMLLPQQIISTIAASDLLVLPSRWDGWGLVVNEALMASVPVVVSDMCGAADMIADGIHGFVFRSEDHHALQRALSAYLDDPQLRKELPRHARTLSDRIGTDSAAAYLIEILRGGGGTIRRSTVEPPWKHSQEVERPSLKDVHAKPQRTQ